MSWEADVETDTAIDNLRREGIYRWPGRAMSDRDVGELNDELMKSPIFASHVAAKATESSQPFLKVATGVNHQWMWPIFSNHMHDLIRAPHWFELALSFYPMAEAYFDGEFPRLYSLNNFWTAPAETIYTDTQAWHRDGDDRRQLTLFMFGTDVAAIDDGAHLYQRGTHRIPDDKLGRPFREDPPQPNGRSIVETVTGPRGTLMLVDTGGLHKAIPPKTKPRLLFWARYGVSNPPASYAWDSLSPLPRAEIGDRYPSDPKLQEAIRLVVA